jgi:hypothetical protein
MLAKPFFPRKNAAMCPIVVGELEAPLGHVFLATSAAVTMIMVFW